MVRLEDNHEVLYAAFGVATLGDLTVVAAVAGKSILVLDLHLYSNGITTVTVKSAAADHYLFGNGTAGVVLAAGRQLNISGESGVLKTVQGEPLLIANSADIGISGCVAYCLI
jgi:hypothetical protein